MKYSKALRNFKQKIPDISKKRKIKGPNRRKFLSRNRRHLWRKRLCIISKYHLEYFK
jgi:hypothetical protein